MTPELEVRKILARTYLNENRLAESLDVFRKILLDYPDDLETLLILGNFYLASGDGATAKALFLHAQTLSPQNPALPRQIALAEETGAQASAEPSPTDFAAIARLLGRLTGRGKTLQEQEILRAAQLLQEIIHSPSPAEQVARRLDEIDELLPALLELNIRQAYQDSRPDLAEALRDLQHNIDSLVSARPPTLTVFANPQTFTVQMVLPNPQQPGARMSLLMQALQAQGCTLVQGFHPQPGAQVAITANPHTNPNLLPTLHSLHAANIPILVDLDADFEKQPVSHPAYASQGLGNLARSQAYTAALSLAHTVTTPSELLAASLRGIAASVRVLPDAWSSENPLWQKPPKPRPSLHLGWVAQTGQLEDLLLVRRYLVRILREFENTRILILGDPQAYRLFETLPENRRLYLPAVEPQEFPHLLSQLDVILLPLRNLPYHLAMPDTLLMQAGAKSLPWLASPMPAFRHWSKGGILCETPEDWHLNLRHLVMDADLRFSLGQEGKRAAQTRELEQVAPRWMQTLRHAIAHPRKAAL